MNVGSSPSRQDLPSQSVALGGDHPVARHPHARPLLLPRQALTHRRSHLALMNYRLQVPPLLSLPQPQPTP